MPSCFQCSLPAPVSFVLVFLCYIQGLGWIPQPNVETVLSGSQDLGHNQLD
jgi:hypothetical protein